VVKRFKLGENLVEVRHSVYSLVAPALGILQDRVTRADSAAASPGQSHPQEPEILQTVKMTSSALETVRSQWCAFLAKPDCDEIPREAGEVLQDMLTVVLDPPPSTGATAPARRMGERLTQKEDLRLAEEYASAVGSMKASLKAGEQKSIVES